MIAPAPRMVPGVHHLPDAVSRPLQDALSRTMTLHGAGGPVKLLRRHLPICGRRRMILITRAADIREVLRAHDTFHVPYLPSMHQTIGSFLLGYDGTPEYWRVSEPLTSAEQRLHGRLRSRSRAVAESILAGVSGAAGAERIDLIAELTDPVIAQTMSEYLGLPPEPERLRHGRDLFAGIFINPFAADSVLADAQEAASALSEQVTNEMHRRRSRAPDGEADLLSLLIAAAATPKRDAGDVYPLAGIPAPQRFALTHQDITVSMVGLISAWTTSVSRAMGLAIDVLLDQPPETLAGLRRTVCDGGSEAGQLVWAHLLEAMRFKPPAPALARTSVAAQPIATGSPHERIIAQGAGLLLLLGSAMMDETELQHPPPHVFSPGRRRREYLVFGHGMHECFGRRIAEEQMTGITEALLTVEGLRRASPVEWTGAYPRRLLAAFKRA